MKSARVLMAASLVCVTLGIATVVIWANAQRLGISTSGAVPPPVRKPRKAFPAIKPFREFTGPTKGLATIVFSPDGRHLASAGEDNLVRIWDVQTGQEAKELEGHADRLFAIGFSHDGRRIISSSYDVTTLIWNWERGEIVAKLDNSGFYPLFAALAGDDKLALVSADNEVVVWDIAQEEPVRRLDAGGTLAALAVSPDGRQVATASEDCRVTLWDVQTGQALARRSRPIFSPMGSTRREAAATKPELKNQVFALSFLDDHRVMILDSSALWVWDRAQGDRVVPLRGGGGNTLAITPDRSLCARLGAFKVEELAADSPTLYINDDESRCAAFSNEFLAVAGKYSPPAALRETAALDLRLYKVTDLRERLDDMRQKRPRVSSVPATGKSDLGFAPPWTDGG